MKQRGITLIETMIILCIVLILAAVAFPALMGKPVSKGNISFGINGMTESRCIEGYKFVIGDGGQARQIIDESGKGVRCDASNTGPQSTTPYER